MTKAMISKLFHILVLAAAAGSSVDTCSSDHFLLHCDGCCHPVQAEPRVYSSKLNSQPNDPNSCPKGLEATKTALL